MLGLRGVVLRDANDRHHPRRWQRGGNFDHARGYRLLALPPCRPLTLSPFRPVDFSPFRALALSPCRPFAPSPLHALRSRRCAHSRHLLHRPQRRVQKPRVAVLLPPHALVNGGGHCFFRLIVGHTMRRPLSLGHQVLLAALKLPHGSSINRVESPLAA